MPGQQPDTVNHCLSLPCFAVPTIHFVLAVPLNDEPFLWFGVWAVVLLLQRSNLTRSLLQLTMCYSYSPFQANPFSWETHDCKNVQIFKIGCKFVLLSNDHSNTPITVTTTLFNGVRHQDALGHPCLSSPLPRDNDQAGTPAKVPTYALHCDRPTLCIRSDQGKCH